MAVSALIPRITASRITMSRTLAAAGRVAAARISRLMLGLPMLGLMLVCLATAPASAQETGQEAPSTETYTVQEGDTLYGIAQRFGTSVRALMRWNDLDAPSIQVGQTLRVRPPKAPADTSSETGRADDQANEQPPANGKPNESDTRRNTGNGAEGATDSTRTDSTRTDSTRTAPGRLTAQSGDTFIDIALRLGTTADTLFAMNDSLRAPLAGGETVLVPPRFGAPTHVVAEGETLYSIAGAYGVSVRALQSENNLEDATIQPGQRLAIPGRVATSPTPPAPDRTGPVAIYPPAFAGRLTASGEAYDPNAFVGSHPTLPYGSVVLLSVPDTRSHCFVKIVDRGPVEDDVIMDVSDAVASQVGLDPDGETVVQLRVVWQAR